ncbi:MAG: LLM class flavin-dependent oxidoreductase [Gammaproteobacteria bacterium]|nr:LLM class flavin-dependent oxidoreductase [Gammaproteobacteria bacterium]
MQVDVFIPPGLSVAETIELGTLAERNGIRAVWAYNYIADPDPFTHLSWLARETQQIRIGPVAVSPFQLHPLMMANSLLTLNELSNGRADIVVGGGGAVMTAMGLRPKRKVRAVRECVEFLRQAADSRDTNVNYSGELYTIRGYQAEWLTQSAPGIFVGANGPQMCAMAARVADGIMMSDFTVPMVEEMAKIARDTRAAVTPVSPEFRINNFFAWHVKDDKQAAIQEAKRYLVLRGILRPHYLLSFMPKDESDFVQERMSIFWDAWRKQTGEFPGIPDALIDKLVDNLTLTGDLSDVDRLIEELKRFDGAGCTEIALGLHDNPAEGIAQIGKYVVPALS